MSFTARFATIDEANEAAEKLISKGVPEVAITIVDKMDELMQSLSLGAGVGVAATESLVESHDDPERFTMTVETGSDPHRDELCEQVLSQ